MKRRPTVVHLITSLKIGGAEMFLAQLLPRMGDVYQHIVIFLHDGPVLSIMERNGILCYRVSAPGSYYNPLLFFRLWWLIRSWHPVCIKTDLWVMTLFGRIIARLLSVPCIAVLHADYQHHGKIRSFIDSLFPISPTACVAVSARVHESFSRCGWYQGGRHVIIKNGTESTFVRQQAIELVSGISPQLHTRCDGKFVVGAVGRLVPVKNYMVLLHSFFIAVRQHTDMHLIIVGSGPEEWSIRSYIDLHNMHHAVTLVQDQLAYPYYSLFHCFVQPSKGEGTSIALLEALSMSVPVIVAGINGKHDLIQHKVNGLVTVCDDVYSLAEAIMMYKIDLELREAIAVRGYEYVTTEYALSRTARAYDDLLQRHCARG